MTVTHLQCFADCTATDTRLYWGIKKKIAFCIGKTKNKIKLLEYQLSLRAGKKNKKKHRLHCTNVCNNAYILFSLVILVVSWLKVQNIKQREAHGNKLQISFAKEEWGGKQK